jgi:hypothetical protein
MQQPHFSLDGDDGYDLYWKVGKKELYITFTGHTVEFTKVWGTNIEHEMEVGCVVGFQPLWSWLNEP